MARSPVRSASPDYLPWLCRHSSGLRFRAQIAEREGREPDLQRRANTVA